CGSRPPRCPPCTRPSSRTRPGAPSWPPTPSVAAAGLSPAARALGRYLARYRGRYTVGVACLLAATGSSLAIPWTVQRAIEALEADRAGAAIGRYVGLVLLLAVANGIARLGSRFAILGGAPRGEPGPRNHLLASL